MDAACFAATLAAGTGPEQEAALDEALALINDEAADREARRGALAREAAVVSGLIGLIRNPASALSAVTKAQEVRRFLSLILANASFLYERHADEMCLAAMDLMRGARDRRYFGVRLINTLIFSAFSPPAELVLRLVSPPPEGYGVLKALLGCISDDREERGDVSYWALSALWSLLLQPGTNPHLLAAAVPAFLLSGVRDAGADLANWGRVESQYLTVLTGYCRDSEMSSAIRAMGGAAVLAPALVQTVAPVERIKAAFTVSLLVGKDEAGAAGGVALLHAYPDLIEVILDVLCNTLQRQGGRGYSFGNFGLATMTKALSILAISDANKAVLVRAPLLPLLVDVLVQYRDDAPKLEVPGVGTAGGGGDDTESVNNCLETLLQLSFFYGSDDSLRDDYMVPKLGLAELLRAVLALPPARKQMSHEARRNAINLLARLDSRRKNFVEVADANRKFTRQHVMLSYSWASKKDTVTKLGNTLKDLGYEVWRDEVGSALVGGMSGDVDDRMAEAIEASGYIIVCVSPQYKESANCRMEAKYAAARNKKGKLQLIFVMMCENYHTASQPDSVDGWLGFMIGESLWYPLWQDNHITSAAKDISKVIGNSCRFQNSLSSSSGIEQAALAAPSFSAVTAPIVLSATPVPSVSAGSCAPSAQRQGSGGPASMSLLGTQPVDTPRESPRPLSCPTLDLPMRQDVSAEIHSLWREVHSLRAAVEVQALWREAYAILLDDNKIQTGCAGDMTALFLQLGVIEAADLADCSVEHVGLLAALLKPVQANKFCRVIAEARTQAAEQVAKRPRIETPS